MATARLAVQIGDDGSAPLWLGLVAFGRVADELTRHGKGELVSAFGRVQRNSWTDRNGETREQLEIVADGIVSARSVRPGGGRKRSDGKTAGPDRQNGPDPALNDEAPF